MSCCPKAPEIIQGDSSDSENSKIADTEMRQGETPECYLRRAGNPTGLHDDATAYPPDKIKNNDIPLSGGDKVDTTFIMTPGSVKVPTSWTIVSKNTQLPAGILFVSNNATASIKGTFPKETYGKPFKLEITAKLGQEVIDARSFVFSPAKATGSNEIRFIMPLPGGICNSPFSANRVHPVTGINKPHHGCDFKMANRSVKDVVAAADGEVVFVGFESGGAGNYVKIKHLNAAGKHLCTTVYMHMSQIYVKEGQTVVAGQKIGKEGSTGSSTGNHLHFECRLPNGDRVDPLPYIKGEVNVAAQTTPTNDPVPGTVSPQTSEAALTPENVDAKQNGCEPFGDDYPKRDGNDKSVSQLQSPPEGSIFDKAWFRTMQIEVGPHWTSSFPSDPDVIAGAIETKPQRRNDGYVKLVGDSGGETKFGVSQNNNTKVVVKTMGYDVAKKIGYNDYWIRYGADALSKSKPKSSVILFDIIYLCGGGGASSIKKKAGIESMDDVAACEALFSAWQSHFRTIVSNNPSKLRFLNGWLKRTRDTLEYAKQV